MKIYYCLVEKVPLFDWATHALSALLPYDNMEALHLTPYWHNVDGNVVFVRQPSGEKAMRACVREIYEGDGFATLVCFDVERVAVFVYAVIEGVVDPPRVLMCTSAKLFPACTICPSDIEIVVVPNVYLRSENENEYQYLHKGENRLRCWYTIAFQTPFGHDGPSRWFVNGKHVASVFSTKHGRLLVVTDVGTLRVADVWECHLSTGFEVLMGAFHEFEKLRNCGDALTHACHYVTAVTEADYRHRLAVA